MLILAATPIGNLSDASVRLVEALQSAEHIAAEDTRTLIQLAKALKIRIEAKLYSLHEHNESARLEKLVEIAQDADLLVVSDAGMPTVSDPGFLLVRECVAAGVEVISIPGPSAVLAALAVSGLPTDRFCFEGFLPRKSGERKRVFENLKQETRTMIFFEAPHRIEDSIADAISVLGAGRKATVSRELTKKFEHTERGTLEDLLAWAKTSPKGEMVFIIAGASPESFDLAELGARALALKAQGLSLKEAATEIANITGMSKSGIYEQALLLKP
ncbi:MAG: 16S rRNA (cytidine(1402)-2'-O)-methyltransferase [Aquiluna sp.]|nr:16S rRNA (cytidine(1402)-2'-O)-methyltransferase [Aquiluna sp.]MCF8545394.1 16S rRNA (cytidine(1402)-2'-O)-methyltransferase [Aquiluna sp.]